MSFAVVRGVKSVALYYRDTGVQKKLDGFTNKLQKQALRKASREVAKFTQQLARELAPEDTGELVASIKVRAAKRSKAKSQKNTVSVNVNTDESLFQGDTFYGGFMEFGTKQRVNKAGQNRGQIERGKFDFLKPALYTHVEKKRRIFITAIQQWLTKQGGSK